MNGFCEEYGKLQFYGKIQRYKIQRYKICKNPYGDCRFYILYLVSPYLVSLC